MRIPVSALVVVLVYIQITFVKADEVCFTDLGCFDDGYPFTSISRPVSHLPWSPANISTEFWLYTRSNKRFSQTLSLDSNDDSIEESNFRRFKNTVFIVHGFQSSGTTGWAKDLRAALLDNEDVNVIVVNWEKGAKTNLIYGQAVANTRVVGAQIALLINRLREKVGVLPSSMHIIGHSLGSHIAGYAGERLRNLARITGLDPAGPYFDGTDTRVRLDSTDADFVDAIHTDGESLLSLGFGSLEAAGHADFYPNGGIDQPGCPGSKNDPGNWWEVACNHGRACLLMIDSVKNQNTPMISYASESYEDFQHGDYDASCSMDNSCKLLGYYTTPYIGEPKKFYLVTNSEAPYAIDY